MSTAVIYFIVYPLPAPHIQILSTYVGIFFFLPSQFFFSYKIFEFIRVDFSPRGGVAWCGVSISTYI